MVEPSPHQDPAGKPDEGVLKAVDWKDYRDHIATAHQDGRRRWLYPTQPEGRFYKARTYLSWLLLWIMFAGPFIRINGNPLLLMNIVDRKFVIMGQVFWPQDLALFAVAMLCFLTGIVLFTAVFGRLWCGWTCPQTLLMEMVFRKIEYWIEGDAQAQRRLDREPMNRRKLGKKVAKHSIFFFLSFVIGNTLLSYIVGSERLIQITTDNPLNHLKGLSAMLLFTLLFYGIFARFREQACTFICPYGRLQSTLLDENTIVVAYDFRRGEPRGKKRRSDASLLGLERGDCVDCHRCVKVCPTGIDIRDGTQMECVNCTACIDACDSVMTKLKRPKGLIRYASLNGIRKGKAIHLTPRIFGYSGGLLAMIGLFLFLVVTRSPVEATVLRAPGTLYQTQPDGRLSNLYTVKLMNKTSRPMEIEVVPKGIEAEVVVAGKQLRLEAEKMVTSSLLLKVAATKVEHKTPVSVEFYSNGQLLETAKTVFVGPSKERVLK